MLIQTTLYTQIRCNINNVIYTNRHIACSNKYHDKQKVTSKRQRHKKAASKRLRHKKGHKQNKRHKKGSKQKTATQKKTQAKGCDTKKAARASSPAPKHARHKAQKARHEEKKQHATQKIFKENLSIHNLLVTLQPHSKKDCCCIHKNTCSRIRKNERPRIVLWCNGSTRVFGSLSPSSNLGRTTNPPKHTGLVAQSVRATDS